MILFAALLISSLLGYFVLLNLSRYFSVAEKIGLGYLLGIGIQTFAMFLLDVAHVPISLLSVISISVVAIAILGYTGQNNLRNDILKLKNIRIPWVKVNFSWLLFLAITVYLCYGIGKKSLYWPVTEYDSVNGYDFMGKVVAAEGTIHNSIFEMSTSTAELYRYLYPPLVANSFAYAYQSGASLSKIMSVLYLVALLFAFYGLVRKYTTATASMLCTAFVAATPEMLSHAALSLTNLPNAAYVAPALITLFIYFNRGERPYFYVSALFMALSLWSRSDSIAFAVAAIALLAWRVYTQKNYKDLVVYTAISLSTFFAWYLYQKLVIKADSSDYILKTLFWDGEKLNKILDFATDFLVYESQFYGVTFWFLYLFIGINLFLRRKALLPFLAVSFLAWVLYTWIYYQIDYVIAPLEAFMKASYKRGMFCFVPLAWFYVAGNDTSVFLFQKLDDLLYGKKS